MAWSSRQRRMAVLGAVLVGAIWAATALLTTHVREQRPTADKVMTFVTQAPLEDLPPMQRDRFVDELAQRVQRLDFRERRALLARRDFQVVFAGMTDDQRRRYLDRTMSHSIQQFMQALNDMDPAERKEVIDAALADLERESRRQNDGSVVPLLSEDDEQRLFREGLKTYFRDASAQTKIALQPLVEQVQHIVRMRH